MTLAILYRLRWALFAVALAGAVVLIVHQHDARVGAEAVARERMKGDSIATAARRHALDSVTVTHAADSTALEHALDLARLNGALAARGAIVTKPFVVYVPAKAGAPAADSTPAVPLPVYQHDVGAARGALDTLARACGAFRTSCAARAAASDSLVAVLNRRLAAAALLTTAAPGKRCGVQATAGAGAVYADGRVRGGPGLLLGVGCTVFR